MGGERRTSPAGWTEEERILALQLYRTHGLAGKAHPAVLALSVELNERRFHPDADSRPNFRNVNGVHLKLANFAALDADHTGKGMTRGSVGDAETWAKYAGDTDLLEAAADAVRNDLALPFTSDGPAAILRRPIEQPGSSLHRVTVSEHTRTTSRSEDALVHRFATWLEAQGHSVCAHHYTLQSPPLRNDLFDETEQRLWEAARDLGRTAVRMTIGQLIDHRRFEPVSVALGVLLPHEPWGDLRSLIASVPAAAAWPKRSQGFVMHAPEPK